MCLRSARKVASSHRIVIDELLSKGPYDFLSELTVQDEELQRAQRFIKDSLMTLSERMQLEIIYIGGERMSCGGTLPRAESKFKQQTWDREISRTRRT